MSLRISLVLVLAQSLKAHEGIPKVDSQPVSAQPGDPGISADSTAAAEDEGIPKVDSQPVSAQPGDPGISADSTAAAADEGIPKVDSQPVSDAGISADSTAAAAAATTENNEEKKEEKENEIVDDTTVANENENGLSNQNGEKEDVTDVARPPPTPMQKVMRKRLLKIRSSRKTRRRQRSNKSSWLRSLANQC